VTKKTLAICGDSYMSPVSIFPGKHFAEILALRLDYELIPLSRNGMSNGGIALQLESVAKLRPDITLIGTTFQSRIEYPITNSMYDRIENSKNILYKGSYSMSSFVENEYTGSNPILVSTNVGDMLDESKLPYFPFYNRAVDNFDEKVKAIQNYFAYLYHDGWKKKQDQLLLYATLHQLESLGLNYFICFDYVDLVSNCPWIKNDISKEIMYKANMEPLEIQEKMPFHTSFELQEEFAEIVFNKIKGI
jgi:hypothetical protein